MNLRDKLQESWATEFLKKGKKGILHLCPRAGKIRTSIRIFDKIMKNPTVLICYPDKNIQQSWENDFQTVGYTNPNIEYVTHISLDKVSNNVYDIIVCDEIHLLSENQKRVFKMLMKNNPKSHVLGLSGTLSAKTEEELARDLDLAVFCNYTLDEAIADEIISDYKIHVLTVSLDDKIIVDPKKKKTEKQKYNGITWIISKKGPSLFLNLARMRIIHNSSAKLRATQRVLGKLKDKRVLVFCPNNDIATQLGISLHTAKYNNQTGFEEFIKDDGSSHMAVCKIGNTGVSMKNLEYIVVNAFDSNSENLTQRICRSLILDYPGKVSKIYIVSSNEEVELKWLNKSLEFFDKSKITYGNG